MKHRICPRKSFCRNTECPKMHPAGHDPLNPTHLPPKLSTPAKSISKLSKSIKWSKLRPRQNLANMVPIVTGSKCSHSSSPAHREKAKPTPYYYGAQCTQKDCMLAHANATAPILPVPVVKQMTREDSRRQKKVEKRGNGKGKESEGSEAGDLMVSASLTTQLI